MNKPHISRWFQQKQSAISLRFDDSTSCHVKTAIPLLNQYGFKGTFMINPGRAPYKKHRRFWEGNVLDMGHDLGNHTWHHKGARTLEEAKSEIGSVSELIWHLRPHKSKLTAFASGGGEKWGGVKWSDAEPGFKEIASGYHLIDLYDGKHPSYRCDCQKTADDLIKLAESAENNKAHQPYHFHEIVRPYTTLKGIARGIVNGYDLAFPPSEFEAFLHYLYKDGEAFWVAPIVDILKYDAEFREAHLSILDASGHTLTLGLSISIDLELYDHPLTLVIPDRQPASVVQMIASIPQPLEGRSGNAGYSVDIMPVDSQIVVMF